MKSRMAILTLLIISVRTVCIHNPSSSDGDGSDSGSLAIINVLAVLQA